MALEDCLATAELLVLVRVEAVAAVLVLEEVDDLPVVETALLLEFTAAVDLGCDSVLPFRVYP